MSENTQHAGLSSSCPDGKQIEEFAEEIARQELKDAGLWPPLPVPSMFPHILSSVELAYVESLQT